MKRLALVLACLPSIALAQPNLPTKAVPKVEAVPKASIPQPPTVKQPSTTLVEVPVIPGEPQTQPEVIAAVKDGVALAKAKNWFGFSSIAILLVVFILKAVGLFKNSKRLLYIIVPGLGVIAMLLAGFVGGISWNSAWLVLTSAPCAALLNDFVKRGILGKEQTTPINRS